MTPEEKRHRVIEEAERIAKLPKENMIAAMYPADKYRVALGMFNKQSKCALFARAVLCSAGVQSSDMDLPYANRFDPAAKEKPADAVAWLKRLPGYHRYGNKGNVWPGWLEGNVYLIMGNSDSSLHVLIPVGMVHAQNLLVSLDGTGDSSGVRRVSRDLVMVTGHPALFDKVMGTRKVHGWVDVSETI